MNILVIDDDKIALTLIAKMLSSAKYNVLQASDAFDAFHYLENEKVDLVITDIGLPNISGIALINLLRKYYQHENPIIFISSTQVPQLPDMTPLGVYDFVPKPIDYDLLFSKIRALSQYNQG